MICTPLNKFQTQIRILKNFTYILKKCDLDHVDQYSNPSFDKKEVLTSR